MKALQYFVFSAGEDGFGQGCWEGLASVRAVDLPAAEAELQALLDTLQARSPGARGPWEDGGVWDWHHDRQREGDWWSLHLSVHGPQDWGEALFGPLGE